MGKKTKIRLSSNLDFGVELITEVIDIIAKRGAGKTYTATKLAEEMRGVGAQVVVVDPVGNWYGLRLGADGKADGGMDFVVLGGRHGDIPLEASAGSVVAKTIVDTGMSAILDVSLMTKAKQRRFVTDFSTTLLEERKRHPEAMHLFWEEAYRFMPQKQTKGSKGEMLEATEELVTMGRNFGIGSTIIALRSALVSKNVLTQAGVLIAMHTNHPSDQKVIDMWVESQKLEKRDLNLEKLKKGDAYVWWPDTFGLAKTHVAKKKTFDASATPKFGEKYRTRKLKPVDLDALRTSMSESIERVQGNDPRLLKRRIAQLEKELAAEKDSPQALPVDKKDLDDFRDALSSLESCTATLRDAVKKFDQKYFSTRISRNGSVLVSPKKIQPTKTKRKEESGVKLVAGALRMLKALASTHPGTMTKKQVATAATLKSSSGTFSTYWSKLHSAGFIAKDGHRWGITQEGFDFLGDDVPEQPDSPEEKVDFWCARLSGRAKELLRFLFQNQDEQFTKEELGDAVGLTATSGTFSTYLSSLTSNNLAVRNGRQYGISPDLL